MALLGGRRVAPRATARTATPRSLDAGGRPLARGAYSPDSQIVARLWTLRRPRCPTPRSSASASRRRGGCARRCCRRRRPATGRSTRRATLCPGVLLDVYGETAVLELLTGGNRGAGAAGLEAAAREVFAPGRADRPRERRRPGRSGSVRPIQIPNPRAEIAPRPLPRERPALLRRRRPADRRPASSSTSATTARGCARSRADGRVLNLFSYSGAFSVAALAGGASRAVDVDSSAAALALAREHRRANGFPADDADFVEADVFEDVRRRVAAGERWDVVVCDPPAFAKKRADVERAARGYKDVNRLAMSLVAPGRLAADLLVLRARRRRALPEDRLLGEPRRSGATFSLAARQGAGPDHPVSLDCPEGEYLKGLWLRRLGARPELSSADAARSSGLGRRWRARRRTRPAPSAAARADAGRSSRSARPSTMRRPSPKAAAAPLGPRAPRRGCPTTARHGLGPLTPAERRELRSPDSAAGACAARVPAIKVGITRPFPAPVGFDGCRRILRPGRVARRFRTACSNGPPTGACDLDGVLLLGRRGRAAALTCARRAFPAGSRVYVYGGDGEAHGPYGFAWGTRPEGFWTNTVFADRIFLEVRLPAAASAADLAQGASFSSARVVHLEHPGFAPSAARQADASRSTEVGRLLRGPQLRDAGGVSRTSTRDPGGRAAQLRRPGARLRLLGRPDEHDGGRLRCPYLLTANHCFSTQASATSLEAFWQYRTATCNGAYPPESEFPRTLGSTLLATGRRRRATSRSSSSPSTRPPTACFSAGRPPTSPTPTGSCSTG